MANCSHLDESDRKTALLTMGLLALVAVLVCSTAALLIGVFKLYKYFSHRLALYQVVGALCYGFFLVMELAVFNYYQNEDVYSIVCKIVGFFTVYTVWIKMFFSTWIILHLFCFTVFNKNLEFLEIPFIVLSVCFPILFVWIPFVHDLYGLAGPWCWIQSWEGNCIENKSTYGIVEQFTLFFGPAMIISCADIVAICVIICTLACYKRKSSRDDETPLIETGDRRKALKELLPLLAYPIIFCVILVPPLFSRIYSVTTDDIYSTGSWFLATAIFVAMWSLMPGLVLILHICILKLSKKKCSLPCHRQHKSFRYQTGLTASEEMNSNMWHVTNAGKDSSGSCDSEAYIPRESEVDVQFLNRNC